MSTPKPRVAAMVLARDRADPLRATLDAILAQEPAPDVLLLIDNDATHEVAEEMRRAAGSHPDAEILALGRNLGCAGGFEAGIARLLQRDDIDLVCGFDDDATPLPGCLAALTDAATSLPAVGSVGATSHDPAGTLAWPMYIQGAGREPARTVDDVRRMAAKHGGALPVANLAWHGLMIPADVLRRHGNIWGDLFLQYEDIEFGMRLRGAGLRCYLVAGAECLHPAPPAARELWLLGRQIEITSQNGAKEYLTLRNGIAVRRRYEGARFWYGSLPLMLLRGFLSSLALSGPRTRSVRHVFVQAIVDGARSRLGPPPPQTAAIGPRRR
jgi:rhamnopyranosyl-N-acetylglucosaminyl-diphospho-decaprenol beta-1,3/1,4-galactofuranosyltransferase